MKKKLSYLFEIPAVLLALAILSPLFIVVVNSFKSREQIFNNPFAIQTDSSVGMFHYYHEAAEQMNFISALTNSLVITIISVVLIGLVSSMAAWVLVRSKTRLSNIIFSLFVMAMLIPFQTIMIPLKRWMDVLHIGDSFHMLDSTYGLIFMYVGFGLPLAVFLFHGFIKNIPVELEEAAKIDGYSSPQIFFRVVAPLLKPIYFTVAILNTLWIWNDYLLPSIVIQSADKRTIPLSTFYFFGEFTIVWNEALAGLVLTIIPVIIFFIFAQKYIIQGVTSGAVK